MFKKEKTAHEFAEDTSIKKLLDGGFLKIDESQYEYNENCHCKRCKEYTIASGYGGYSFSNINK